MKTDKVKKSFLEQLSRIPIIQLACEKIGVARSTVYHWRKVDKKFKEKMEQSLIEGETMINDMGEAQLITLIKDKNWQAIQFWLRHHHPKYTDKIEISGKVESEEKLSPEQASIVKAALKLANLNKKDE